MLNCYRVHLPPSLDYPHTGLVYWAIAPPPFPQAFSNFPQREQVAGDSGRGLHAAVPECTAAEEAKKPTPHLKLQCAPLWT